MFIFKTLIQIYTIQNNTKCCSSAVETCYSYFSGTVLSMLHLIFTQSCCTPSPQSCVVFAFVWQFPSLFLSYCKSPASNTGDNLVLFVKSSSMQYTFERFCCCCFYREKTLFSVKSFKNVRNNRYLIACLPC